MQKRLQFIVLFIVISGNSLAQEIQKTILNKDSIPKTCLILNDSLELWKITPDLQILKSDNQTSIWRLIKNIDFWKVSENTSALNLLDFDMDLWIQGNSVQIWTDQNGERHSSSAPFSQLSDSSRYWFLNDSLHLLSLKDSFMVWKVNPHTKFHKITFLDEVLYLSDTTKLWLISDSVHLWTYKDSTVLWEKSSIPNSWNISSSTKVWPITTNIELWQTNNKKSFWQEDTKNGKWEKIDSVQNWFLGDSSLLFRINNSTLVRNKGDSVCIWKSSKKRVFSIMKEKTGKVWEVSPPPPPIIIVEDTTQVVEKKEIESLSVDNNTHFWDLSKSVKIWQIKDEIEVWEHNKNVKIWQINDSTKIITIFNKVRLSFIGEKIVVWAKNDTTNKWTKKCNAKTWKYSSPKLGQTWKINDSIKYTENGDIWNVFPNYNIANIEESWRGIEVWKHPKGIEVWTVKNEIRFWEENDSVSVWRPDKCFTFMEVNDTTKVWQVNSEIRLSQVNEVLIVWERKQTASGNRWIVSKEFPPLRFQYQGKPVCIKIFKNLQIWQHHKNVSFWRRDPKTKVWKINDIFKVYSFIPERFQPKAKRKSNWKIGGVGGLNFSQAYFKDWVKGGENKLALLSQIKLFANYSKNKTDFKNELELKLGTIKPGENDFRKNEDLIKISSNLGIKASKNWLISINSNTATQFLEGYKYPNDSVPVSRFLSPLKHIGGVGANYNPTKNLTVFLSPLSLKSTFVNDTLVGQTKFGVPEGKKAYHKIGFQFNGQWKKEFIKNIFLQTKLNLFSSYVENQGKVDVDWETTLILKLNKFIKTTIFSHVLYDYDVKIPVKNEAGEKIDETDKIQFKQTLSVGFAYNF